MDEEPEASLTVVEVTPRTCEVSGSRVMYGNGGGVESRPGDGRGVE